MRSPTATDFARRGPHAVGLRTTTIAAAPRPGEPERRLPTAIWYPAADAPAEAEAAPHPLGLPHRAALDLTTLDRPCPLVVFSHGNSGLREQSTFLTTHLASWGFVVAAPDHVGNTFREMLALPDDEARRATHRRMREQRPYDLLGVVRALLEGGARPEGLPPLDAARLGALGHSFGGWTAIKLAALEPRLSAICGLAPVAEPFVGRKAFAPSELPLPEAMRTLVIAARDDVLVDLETSIEPLFQRLGPGARLEIVERADHFHFCDGIPLLHGLHEASPREGQPRPTRPLAELRSESSMHALLGERVTRFFAEAIGGTAPPA
jgi:dienelactone hydrolase